MSKIALTVDSGICAREKENTIIIPAQINSSLGFTYCDNKKEITNREMLSRNRENGEIFNS